MHHEFGTPRPTRVSKMHHSSAPLRPTCVEKFLIKKQKAVINQRLKVLIYNRLVRKKWCISMLFGAFSRPTRVTKKFPTFFQSLGALSIKGLFFFGAFLLESAHFKNSSFVYLIQQKVP